MMDTRLYLYFVLEKKWPWKNLILAEYIIFKITLTQIRIKELLLSYIDLKRKEKPIVIVWFGRLIKNELHVEKRKEPTK